MKNSFFSSSFVQTACFSTIALLSSASLVQAQNEFGTEFTSNPSVVREVNEFNIETDLVSLHHDMGPDKDDGHASTANFVIATELGMDIVLVGGTTPKDKKNDYLNKSTELLDSVWERWINANANWEAAALNIAEVWFDIIKQGGNVWVAESGVSDFTADVITHLNAFDPSLDTKKYINVIQHSLSNEERSNQERLDFVKENVNYIKIDDGNVSGKTAKLKGSSPEFVEMALASDYAEKWKAAFDFLDPESDKLDFSESVELLYILGIDTNKIDDAKSFAEYFLTESIDAESLEPDPSSSVEGSNDTTAIDIEANNRTVSSITETAPEQVTAPVPTSETSSSNCLDVDGDGWGWDGQKSCEVAGTAAASSRDQHRRGAATVSPPSAECLDPDGDGWGWDGSASCRVSITNSPSPSSSIAPGDCVDTDGDGWGWNGSESCRVSPSNNTSSTTPAQAPIAVTNSPPTAEPNNTGLCYAIAPTLASARTAFASKCPGQNNISKRDCDPLKNSNNWACANVNFDGVLPGNAGSEISTPTPTPSTIPVSITTTDAPPSEPSNTGLCYAIAPTLASARTAFASKCPGEDNRSKRDCDSLKNSNDWACANVNFDGVLPDNDLSADNNSTNDNDEFNVTAEQSQPSSNQAPASNQTSVSQSSGGIVVIQAENTKSAPGQWRRRTDVSGFTGSGHMTFEGNEYRGAGSSPTSPLEYSFRIETAGTYELMMRIRRFNVPGHNDYANDGFVKMDGDFTSAVSKPSTADLKTSHKFFGGQLSWAWSGTKPLEIGPKYTPLYNFKAGKTYTLTLSGRSKGWSVDKIVLFNQATSNRNQAMEASSSTFSSPPTVNPNITQNVEPTAGIASASAGLPIELGRASAQDLIVLHYDHAPDQDDGHAVVAARAISNYHRFAPLVVHGAYGTNENTYNAASINVTRAAFGDNFLDAHNDWQNAVVQSYERWAETLNNGGKIWIAEGGQSDITADIVKLIKASMPEVNTRNSITVVQHSKWNEDKTTAADLNYVKNNTNYIKIEDGNGSNSTADLNMKSAEFVRRAESSRFGSAWKAAFDYLDPSSRKLDFSDTVGLLYILNIPTSKIATVNDFADVYF